MWNYCGDSYEKLKYCDNKMCHVVLGDQVTITIKVVTHYINWGILLSLFRKIPKIPKTTPVDGYQHVRGQCGIVFHAKSNGEVNVQIS